MRAHSESLRADGYNHKFSQINSYKNEVSLYSPSPKREPSAEMCYLKGFFHTWCFFFPPYIETAFCANMNRKEKPLCEAHTQQNSTFNSSSSYWLPSQPSCLCRLDSSSSSSFRIYAHSSNKANFPAPCPPCLFCSF